MRRYALFLLLLLPRGCCEQAADKALQSLCRYYFLTAGLVAVGIVVGAMLHLWWLWFVVALVVVCLVLRLLAIGVLYKIEKVRVVIPISERVFPDRGFSFLGCDGDNVRVYVGKDSEMKSVPTTAAKIYLARRRSDCDASFGEIPVYLYRDWIEAD